MLAISARQSTKQDTQKPRASAPTKKRKVVKRRGRARGELDSDDEIEREPATDDSESDDDSDSLDSATDDSETEPVSEDAILHDRAHLPTPRSSKSPESVGKLPFFAPTGSWSEMVMDEAVNGSAELPVVDFADFGAPPLAKSNKPTRKPKKAPKTDSPPESRSRATPAELSEQPNTPPPAEPIPTPVSPPDSRRIPHNRRQTLPGHSARQLYQQKLDSDPSFVPTIGNFWSHDDRLIDTELRNLSGWWRGRGTRGRGKRDYNIRGRGGFVGHGKQDSSAIEEEEATPADMPWTHDGFEEMKKKDEQRRAEQAAVRQSHSPTKRGGFAGRGRGNFMQGRGRGGYTRGGFSSPARSRNDSPFTSGIRVRFAMKPELMWTKQHEAFLYFDSSLKPRPGQAPGFRVRLPGQQLQVIRVSFSTSVPPEFPHKTATAGPTDDYVVRLPKPVQEEKDLTVLELNDTADAVSKDTSLPTEDLSALAEPRPSSLAPDSTSSLPQEVVESNELSQSEILTLESTPLEPEQQTPAKEELMPPPGLGSSESPVTSPVQERPVLPPLQTTFTPPPPPVSQSISQPSPAYGSPFGFAMPLPPGIAMSAHGMPYELATGRPVYLQPPAMYTPRPMIHSHYLPSHMHHHSLSNASPDFLAHSASHTPPINGFIDPATGTPIFSFPRQTSRIEIRAPGETPSPAAGTKLTTKASPPLTSSLRSSSASFQPAAARVNAESSDSSRYYLPSSTPSDTPLPSYEPQGLATMEDPADPSTMMQHYYPQQYYYPEPYGYSQYMDMSHTGQTYHMYGVEQAPQGTVYY